MDQPHQPSNGGAFSIEWIITSIIVGLGGLGSLWARSKIRIDGMREKVKAEAAPQLEVEYLKSSREITEDWKEEVVALRLQVDKVRDDYERRLSTWMDRAMAAEKQIPRLEAEILMLKSRVADLEKQVNGGPHIANPPA